MSRTYRPRAERPGPGKTSKPKKGHQINRGKWTEDRIRKIKQYLRKPSAGDPDEVRTQLEHYKNYRFKIKNGRLFVDVPGGDTKEILSDKQVHQKIRDMYAKDEEHVGRIPTIYHTLNKKFVNISWAKVEKAVKSTTNYQLYDARQVSKPRGGPTVDAERVGALLEIDLAVFSQGKSTGILPRDKNAGYTGLVVVIDALSGYVQAEAYKTKTIDEVTSLTRTILRKFQARMKLKGGTAQHDGGGEFGGGGGGTSKFTDMVTSFGIKEIALPKSRSAVHVEGVNNQIRKNINSRLAASGKKSWVSIYRKIISGLNNTSFTDWRAPQTPLEITKLSPKEQRKLFFLSKAKKEKRNAKLKGANLRDLEPGEFVRIALDAKTKGEKPQQKGPRQKWSAKVYTISKRSKKGVYTLKEMPKRRYARYWLQLVPDKRDVEGKDVKKQGARQYDPEPEKERPVPPVDARGYPAAGQAGSRGRPYRSRQAAFSAGHKTGDPVHWRRGQKVYRKL